MKRILLTLILTGSIAANAQKITSPGTGVNWNLDSLHAHFPSSVDKTAQAFTLKDSLEILSGDTLLIENSLNWLLDSAVLVTVSGHIEINGGTQVIQVTASDSSAPYAGFRLEEFSSARFYMANITYGGGIRVLTEDFKMDWCGVSHHYAGASTGAAINFSRGKPIVTNSNIAYNQLPAFASAANQEVAPRIINNVIRYNTLSNSNRPQINLGPSGTADTTYVIRNTIIGDRTMDKVGGISVSSLLGMPLNAIIDSNIIYNNRYGITMAGSNIFGYIRGNYIDSNNTQNVPIQGGSGISLNSPSGPLYVVASHNEIINNLWGITLIGQASINLGDTASTNYNIGKNTFSGNGNGGSNYALFNNTDLTVTAMNNCWESDTSTGLTAEDVISHQNDDPALGEVFFNPVWDCMENNMGLMEQEVRAIDIYPNPTKGTLNLNLAEPGVLMIHNLNGALLRSEAMEAGLNNLNLDVAPGVYIIGIKTNSNYYGTKLIVE